MSIRSYRDLKVWNAAMDLMVECYRLSAGFPADERFGLTSQLRRVALAIPANIAEGHGKSRRGYLYHVGIARGSYQEVETLILAAERLGFVSASRTEPSRELGDPVGRMLTGLRTSLQRLESQASSP
jgi:four helix bundle protein